MTLLRIENLSVAYGEHVVVKHVSLDLQQGKTLAIVGESGSGKSTIANTIMGLTDSAAKVSGKIFFENELLDAKRRNKVRGSDLTMIFQNPMSALNPLLKVRTQVCEQILRHNKVTKQEAFDRAIELLAKVGIPSPETKIDCYPHEFSGGMCQRVMIAMALSCNPKLLIADEPTTALDVTIQARILDDIKRLVEKENMGLLIISHDLAVVGKVADRIAVMRDGLVVESNETAALFKYPSNRYTKRLLKALPDYDKFSEVETKDKPVMSVENLAVCYDKQVKVVDGVDFTVNENEILGLVGESGSGKSTTIKAIIKLLPIADGDVKLADESIAELRGKKLKEYRQNVQMIFQDPHNSLNPHWRLFDIIADPLRNMTSLSRREIEKKVFEMMELCELDKTLRKRFPHQLSGGQCQRVGIARALIVEPKVLLCDEPVSSLDVLIQAQIIELIKRLQKKIKFSVIFISHDLSVVKDLCHRVIIMKSGKIVEEGVCSEIFTKPKASYTKNLIDSIPKIGESK